LISRKRNQKGFLSVQAKQYGLYQTFELFDY